RSRPMPTRRPMHVVTISLSHSRSFVYFRFCSSTRAFEEVTACVSEFGLHARHQFSDRRRVGDLADALARAPDVAPGFGFRVAAGAEIHLRLVGDRQILRIETGGGDRRP